MADIQIQWPLISLEPEISMVRYWFERHAYVRGIIGLRAAFYN